MINKIAKKALIIAKNIKKDAILPLPSDITKPENELVIFNSLFKNTRSYIQNIVYQINGTYEKGWYDACAVMIRRLIETLIIEVYEYNQIESKIKDSSGNFFMLDKLISITLNEKSWNLGRKTKFALPKIKDIGDFSAHNRRYTAHRQDIDKITEKLRIVSEELLYLSGLKK